VDARECGGEGLRGQIRRDLGVADATNEVAQHPFLMALIEDTERGRLATTSSEELLIRQAVPDSPHTPTLHCPHGP
jgi:hypothetical protein